MLQAENTLWTWQIRIPPEQIFQEAVPAEKIADHPLRFLTYEGPVQNHTGQVKIADSGEMSLRHRSDDSIVFELCGKILSGLFELRQQPDKNWVLQRMDA